MRRTGRHAASSLLSAASGALGGVVGSSGASASGSASATLSTLKSTVSTGLRRSSTTAAEYAVGQVRDARASAGARVRRKVSFVSVQVEAEFWNDAWGGRWCDGAKVSVKKTKLVVEWQKEEVVAFKIDAALIVEHSEPLSRDFNLLITASQTRLNVRVALFSEHDAEQCVEALEKAGAKIVSLPEGLPPACSSALPSGARTLPSHLRPSFLRPISEGEPLRNSELAKERRASSDFVTAVRMRLDSGRRKVFRRKSTGSEVDMRTASCSSDDAETASIPPTSASPSSISMKEEGANGNGSIWYFPDQAAHVVAAAAAKGDAKESSRGLSTASTKIKKQKKQQSDQSLDSDEISRSSNSSELSESDEYMEEEEEEAAAKKCVECGRPAPTGDETDGMIRSLAERLRFSRSDEDDESVEMCGDGRGGYEPPPKGINNEKLEKFKFLLVNIEEDEDMMEPGEFGVSGDFARCDFDDYPDQVFAAEVGTSKDGDVELGSARPWIRRSFEELDLESVSTRHNSKKRLLQVPEAATAVTRSMENVSTPSASSSLSDPHRRSPRSVRIVRGRFDFGDGEEEGTVV